MRNSLPWSLILRSLILCTCLAVTSVRGAPLTRAEALEAIAQPEASARLAGVERLGEIGRMPDAQRLLLRLADTDEKVRAYAVAAMWQIWSRSGDPAIDKLFARGLEQMQSMAFKEALTTLNTVVQRKPDFAEGWNKRATLYFLMGEYDKSLKDCDEVLKRNKHHFGAMSGAGQIHMQLGNPKKALEFFRRAVDVNPNLDGPAQMIPLLEQHLRDKDQSTT
jgi:tetratricopeptide (TPR) repeat protein